MLQVSKNLRQAMAFKTEPLSARTPLPFFRWSDGQTYLISTTIGRILTLPSFRAIHHGNVQLGIPTVKGYNQNLEEPV